MIVVDDGSSETNGIDMSYFYVHRLENGGRAAERQQEHMGLGMMNNIVEDLRPICAYLNEHEQQLSRGKNIDQLLAQLEEVSNEPFLNEGSPENAQLIPAHLIKQEASSPRCQSADEGPQHPLLPAAEERQGPAVERGNDQEPGAEEPAPSTPDNQASSSGNGGIKRRLTIDRQEKDEYQTGRMTQEAKRVKKGDTTITLGPYATTVKISNTEEEYRLDTTTQTDRKQSNHLPYLRSSMN